MTETYATGALKSPYDIRDYRLVPGAVRIDWEKGYDIEKVLGTKLVTKDQGDSSSCGGQAWAYYGEVLEKLATSDYEPRSAKWIYSQTHEPGGGSWGRRNSDVVIKQGWAREKLVPSYENNKPPSEAFITKPVVVTPEIREDIEVNRALSYMQTVRTIDSIAEAIQNNYGCIVGISGQNGKKWKTAFPEAPDTEVWRHWLYAGKFKEINGKKHVGVKNSWGNVGEDGWQWLSEDFFPTWCFETWTLAWDYKPAAHKKLLIETVRLLKQLVALLTK